MRSLRTSALAATFVFGAGLFTAEALAQAIPPRLLGRVQPQPPANRFGFPMEGWVVVRYTVLPNGQTANVRAVDRMPPGLVDREAVEAVEDWNFEPATGDGAPIEWHNNESMIVFDVETIPFEPSPFFVQSYIQIDALIKEGDFEKARSRNEVMLTTLTSRLAEVGLAQAQSAVINIALGRAHEAYAAIRHATDSRVVTLAPAELKVALQYRNVLELELGDAVGAIATLARRNEIEPVPEGDSVAARVAAIEQALGGDAPIAIKAKVADDYWLHAPTRRTFSIADVNGDLESIQIECDRRRTEIPYSADSEWSLPASWGTCTLMIEGRDDTEFRFFEFP